MEFKSNAMFSREKLIKNDLTKPGKSNNVIKKLVYDLTKPGKSNNVWTYPVLSDSYQDDLTKPGKSIFVWTYPVLSDHGSIGTLTIKRTSCNSSPIIPPHAHVDFIYFNYESVYLFSRKKLP